MGLDESAWDHSVYTRDRDRLSNREISRQFLGKVVSQARKRGFVSKDHFSVDAAFLQAWARTKREKVGARMSYLANAPMGKRSGLVVDGEVRLATGDGYPRRYRIEW